MTTRRAFLQSIPIIAAATTLPAKATAVENCDKIGKKLASAMKTIHGGEWRVSINHKSKIAIVVKS